MSIQEAEKLSTAELRRRAIKEGGIAMVKLHERAKEFRDKGLFLPATKGCNGHIYAVIPI